MSNRVKSYILLRQYINSVIKVKQYLKNKHIINWDPGQAYLYPQQEKF